MELVSNFKLIALEEDALSTPPATLAEHGKNFPPFLSVETRQLILKKWL